MGRSGRRNTVAGAVLVWGLASWAGCGAGGSPSPSPGAAAGEEALGRVSLPLVTTVNDHRYRLSNVYVLIYPQYLSLSSNDPDEPELSASLQTGNYTAVLYQGTLERDDGSGNFVPVVASLISSSYVNFTIFNGTTSTIAFQYQTDGVIVTVGSGQLKVRVAVDEIPPVCAPFGDDCSPGTWCPPTTLTGAPRACIAAGAIAIGQPCTGPLDCVANATCVDQGAGAICAELCPRSGFDASCPSGGICREITGEYGVCAPAVETPDMP